MKFATKKTNNKKNKKWSIFKLIKRPRSFRESHLNIIFKHDNINTHLDCDHVYSELDINDKEKKYQMLCIEEIIRLDVMLDPYFTNLYNYPLVMYITIYSMIDENKNILFNRSLFIIKVLPNSYKKITLQPHLDGEINVIYRCIGYYWFNCYRPILHHDFIKENPTKTICRDPEDCNDGPCSNNEYCNNHGSCFINFLQPGKKYCVCEIPYAGSNCEITLPTIKISEDMILFQSLKAFASFKIQSQDCVECPDSMCDKYQDYKICTKINSELLYCKNDCVEVCGEDVCLKTLSKKNKIYYLKYLKDFTKSNLDAKINN